MSNIDDILHIDMESPYKPNSEEETNYFYGFSGSPRLVARTGHNQWTKSQFERGWNGELAQHSKHYMAIDNPYVVGKWSKNLSMSIIAELDQCKWSYFFPIRTCLRDDNDHQEGIAATVLLIAVEPASLQWEDGIAIALRCRDIVRRYGIFDLEVQIMEGNYAEHAAPPQLEALFSSTYKTTSEKIAPLLSFTGWPIAYLEDRDGQGTVGLHVKLGLDDSTVYGLTCRHVVSANRKADESYMVPTKGRQYHIQASNSTFGQIMFYVQSHISTDKTVVSINEFNMKRWDEWYQFDPSKSDKEFTEVDRKLLGQRKASLAHDILVGDVLAQADQRSQRQIGHLAFHPRYSISSRQHPPKHPPQTTRNCAMRYHRIVWQGGDWAHDYDCPSCPAVSCPSCPSCPNHSAWSPDHLRLHRPVRTCPATCQDFSQTHNRSHQSIRMPLAWMALYFT